MSQPAIQYSNLKHFLLIKLKTVRSFLKKTLKTPLQIQVALIFIMPTLCIPKVFAEDVSKASAKSSIKKPTLIGKFGAWQAYEYTENDFKTCFMLTLPQTKDDKILKRGDVHLMITHRPYSKNLNVVSHQFGYPFKSHQKIDMILTGKDKNEEFKLFTEDETAWAVDTETDETLTRIIISWGNSAILKGVTKKGQESQDTYRLVGALKAYEAICKACKVTPLK